MNTVKLMPLNRADQLLETTMQELEEDYQPTENDQLKAENDHLKGQLESLDRTLVRQQEELDRMHRKILLGGE